ncbi:protein D3-like [Panonychus citri]|uniref:protein D3-like n=1 Tax=Panonychus citri TaxID=50023 RepID=UPI0023081D83|nr:protein D3-like [Panonychus citri]
MDLLISHHHRRSHWLLIVILLISGLVTIFADSSTVNSNSTVNSTDTDSSREETSAEDEDEDLYLPVIECKPNVTIEEIFLENKITQDLGLNFSDHYMALTEIEYSEGLSVHCGNELTPNQTSQEPVIFNYHGGWYEHYSIVMIDPDASKDVGTVLHWMIVNVPGSNYTDGEVSCSYRGPKPPLDTGLHRYITLVYLQQYSGPVTFKDYSQNRYNFNLTSWVSENSLIGPVFGNFFKAQNKSPGKSP